MGRTQQPRIDVSDDPVRGALRAIWATAAPAWRDHAEYVDGRGAAVATAMLDAVGVRPGDRVLELACGPGGVGLAAAQLVGGDGHVVLSDVAPEMTAIAALRADTLGLGNVSTRELDLEQIDEPDESFDVVVCREGLMLVPDPERAARELVRVLRPNGRAAVAVWGPRERNPWLGILFDAVTAQTGMPVPPPGIPGPFSLDDARRLHSLLADAGLADVRVSELVAPFHFASFDDWWATVPSLAGPIAQVLASLPTAVAAAIRADTEQSLAAYSGAEGYALPGATVVGAGRR